MKEKAESSVACNHHRVGFLGLLVTLGIVFGDIGTSPLYVMKAILHTGESISESTILGALSCIIWTLTLQTTIKYVCVALRADNNGEGGILALYALLRRLKSKWIYLLAIIGASTLHQSQPASYPHHPCHHHHHLLRAAVWHREYWQIVWRIYAAMVPAAGRGGSFQHHVLPIDTEGFQPLLCCHAAGEIA